MVEFNNFEVKLIVMEELTVQGTLTLPYEYGQDWLAAARGIERDARDALIHDEYWAKREPEIAQWARDLEITQEQCDSVENLLFDGGNEVFMVMAPSWDGEDDLFDPKSWTDVTMERFPNLKGLTYVGDIEPEVVAELEAAGVEVDEL